MKTICYSYDGNCPCLNCDKQCCIQWASGIVDTEKLCDKAKEHCEKSALEYKEQAKNDERYYNNYSF